MKKTKIFVQAEIPPHLELAWLQHMRDFDTAHPGCHFRVITDSAAKETIEQLKAKFAAISPSFPFTEVFRRGE